VAYVRDEEKGEALGELSRTLILRIKSSLGLVLRSKGLKDTTCVGWFGDD